MAVPRSVLRVPASSSSSNARLARMFPTKVNKNAMKSRATRANKVKKAVPKGGLTKELASLGIEIDEDDAPDDDTDDDGSSKKQRYKLRNRDKSMSGSASVTKLPGPKIVKSKNSYEGPGYLGKSPKITKKGQECTICAETQER